MLGIINFCISWSFIYKEYDFYKYKYLFVIIGLGSGIVICGLFCFFLKCVFFVFRCIYVEGYVNVICIYVYEYIDIYSLEIMILL